MVKKIFNFIRKKSPIILLAPFRWAIGNCSEEIYYGLLKARRENKKIIFLYPEYGLFGRFQFPVSNKEMYDLKSPYCLNNTFLTSLARFLFSMVIICSDFSCFIYEKFVIILHQIFPDFIKDLQKVKKSKLTPSIHILGRSGLWKPEHVDYFSWDIVNSLKWEEQYSKYLPVMLNKDKFDYAEKLRVDMGIPLNKWFVCLHVREAGFHNDIKRFPYSNATILNYAKGIKAITERGGFVVRIGDNTMSPLPPMEQVIDYPHTRYKSELMDLYLINQCHFYIGTGSGTFDTARLFHKRILLTNFTVLLYLSQRKYDLAIMKHFFSKSRKRFLSIKELIEEPFEYQNWGQKMEHNDYIIIENTPDEIYDAVVECLDNPAEYKYSELQEEFIRAMKRRLREGLEEKRIDHMLPGDKVIEKYRIASHIDFYKGTFGKKYLEQNWFKASMNDV